MIVTANSWFNTTYDDYKKNTLLQGLAKYGLKYQPVLVGDKPLVAFVNHGEWLVKCECGGAEKMWEEEMFLCQSCWNGKHGHRVRQATFPKNRKQIETLLDIRPLDNRNWNSNETLADLRRENKEHKVELIGA